MEVVKTSLYVYPFHISNITGMKVQWVKNNLSGHSVWSYHHRLTNFNNDHLNPKSSDKEDHANKDKKHREFFGVLLSFQFGKH